MAEAWVIDHVRTPRGKGKKETGRCITSIRRTVRADAERLDSARRLDPRDVEDVVGRTVSEIEDQAMYRADVGVAAGWPTERPAFRESLLRIGMQAVNFAAMGVMSGQQESGRRRRVESMSRVAAVRQVRPTATIVICANSCAVPQGVSAD